MLTFQPRRLLRGIKELLFPWLSSHQGSPCARLEFLGPGAGIDPGRAGQGHTKGRALLPSAAPIAIIDRERFPTIKGREKDLGWRFLPALFSHRGRFLLKFSPDAFCSLSGNQRMEFLSLQKSRTATRAL